MNLDYLDDAACSQSQACMTWNNHKNVHCMRLHEAWRRICNLASQLDKPRADVVTMSQQKAIKPRTKDSQRKSL